MKHETHNSGGISYSPCRYGGSRILFRGPKRSLAGRYISFIGGTETFGKFLHRPFPTLVEESTGEVCVNMGCINASIDAFLQEPAVLSTCRGSLLNVVQLMGAHNMSNRFYTVHPRRNDRFLRASSVLRAVYPEIDFSDYCFTRHLLGALYDLSPERFEIIREEVQQAWRARMKRFLTEIGQQTLLLWFSDHLPSDGNWADAPEPLRRDPLFVTRSMIDELRPLVHGVVMVQPSARALNNPTDGMVFPPSQVTAATTLLGQAAHTEAAAALTGAIRLRIPVRA